MGSATWLVSQAGRRWVAKAVTPALRAPFACGLSVATLLDEAGIPAGAPVPTPDGRSVVDLDAASLALLTWVEGESRTGSDADGQQVIGETLALTRQALQGASVPGAQRFHWVRPDADHLALRPWIRPAVTAAVAALDRLGPASLAWACSTPTQPPSTSGWTHPADAAASSTAASPWKARCSTTSRRRSCTSAAWTTPAP